MSDANPPPREVQRTFGRVYQTCVDQSAVTIDWQPSSPIIGCKMLTHGQAVFHPTEGRAVLFPGAIRRRRGTQTIAVRTTQRPDLLELFELAVAMEAELRSEVEAARRSRHPAAWRVTTRLADRR